MRRAGVYSEGAWEQAGCISSPIAATRNSPPCCCRVRRSPQVEAGPAAGSRSPAGLRGRPQPIYAEQPGEKTEEAMQVIVGPVLMHVFPSTALRHAFQEVAHSSGNLGSSSSWPPGTIMTILFTWSPYWPYHLVTWFCLHLGHYGRCHLKILNTLTNGLAILNF